MSTFAAGNAVDGEDDFTFTEDGAGGQKKVAVEKEFVFKVVVLGDYSVGKTSLIKRLLGFHSLTPGPRSRDGDTSSDMADSNNDDDDGDDDVLATITPTVGTDFYSLALPQVLPGASLRLQLWDTAGLEKYAAKYENTFRNASFVICVFDVTSASSLHNVVDRHLSIAAEHIPELDQSNIMVVANKIDIIRDIENNTSALRDARKRAQSPETAFAETNDDDTATNTEFFTSAKSVDKDAIVTAKKVQAEVFDLFGEVHYAEVSAKTRQNVRLMLQTVAYALLRNSPESKSALDIPDVESTYDIFTHTVLPMQTPGNSPLGKGAPAVTPVKAAAKTPQPPTPPPAPSLPPLPSDPHASPDKTTSARGQSPTRPVSPPSTAFAAPGTPPKPTASWGATGAFKFDMAPPTLAATAVFSPVEGSDNCNESSPNSPKSADIPSATAPTVAAPPSAVNSRTSVVKPNDVQMNVKGEVEEVEGERTKRPPPPDPNETPQARKEREQAEMNALLGRAGQRKGRLASNSTPAMAAAVNESAAQTADALRNDADKLEDDVAAGRDQAGENPTRRPFTSILDSLGMENNKNNAGNQVDHDDGHQSDDDEDGAQMHARLKDRFAQIEHDIRQDNKMARERAKRAKKTKGKCKCAVM
jgi:small GTP-binding protein